MASSQINAAQTYQRTIRPASCYVFAASAPFSTRKPVDLGAMAIGAILFGYAIHYLFTDVLFIDI